MKLGPSFPPVAMLEAGLAGIDDSLASCALEKHTFVLSPKEQGT